METVTVVYHLEDGSWWAESPDIPGFVAGGDSFEETRRLTREGVEFALEHPIALDERFDEAAMSARRPITGMHVTGFGADVVRFATEIATAHPAPAPTSLGLPPLTVASSPV